MTTDPIKVYVAGPYTRGDVAVNVRRALVVADELADAGFVPYVPHLSHFWHVVFPRPYEWWLQYDMYWLRVCDVVLRLPGESPGATCEVEEAARLGKRVYNSVEDLLRRECPWPLHSKKSPPER